IPGTFPTRLTTMRRRLFPVRTFTALLIVMLSRLMPFTSTSLSPTHRPANSLSSSTLLTKIPRPCSDPPRTLKPSLPSSLLSTVIVWMSSLSSPPIVPRNQTQMESSSENKFLQSME
uniref:Uncharacterized protein n=1 Tax=Cyprinus carpio TaxID=7962 RepID=A0A8C1V2A2_CYPCA